MDLESRIVNELNKIPNAIGRRKLKKLKEIQIQFFENALINQSQSLQIFEETVKKIFQVSSFTLNLDKKIQIDGGLVVITNHLAINKLTKIYAEDLRINSPSKLRVSNLPQLENNDPFIILLAPLWKSLSSVFNVPEEVEIIFVFMKLENVYSNILHKLNAVLIDRNETNQYEKLLKEIKIKIEIIKYLNKKPIIIIFPEGGSSGKSNSGGPYSLLDFKKGYRAIAKEFNYQILPIAIKVDRDINYHAQFGDLLQPIEDTNSHKLTLTKLLHN